MTDPEHSSRRHCPGSTMNSGGSSLQRSGPGARRPNPPWHRRWQPWRRQQTAMVLLILSAGIGLCLRIDSLVSGSGNPAFDWAVIAFWLFVAAGAVRVLVRR